MLKFVVIVLASFTAVGIFGAVFPNFIYSHISISHHNVPTNVLALIGTIFAFYKVVG